MIKVNNKPEIIRQVQTYLRKVNPDSIVALSGVYDENTRRWVMSFQAALGLTENGIVDKETFDLLYERYLALQTMDEVRRLYGSSISFPILFGERQHGMVSINSMIADILDYYGITHRINKREFYSQETSEGVIMLKEIFLMDEEDYIDEIFYSRLIDEVNSIWEFNKS